MIRLCAQKNKDKYALSPLESFKHRLRKIIVLPTQQEVIISYNKSTEKINFIALGNNINIPNNETEVKTPNFEQNMMKVYSIIKKSIQKNSKTAQHDEITNFYKLRSQHLSKLQNQITFFSEESFKSLLSKEVSHESDKFENQFFDRMSSINSQKQTQSKIKNVNDLTCSKQTIYNLKKESLIERFNDN